MCLGGCLLGQGLEDGVHLLGHGHQHQLELRLGAHHAAPLVADVLQGGGDVDFLGALGHSVQHHVHQTVGARATGTVAAVHHDRTRPTAVRLVHFPEISTQILYYIIKTGFKNRKEYYMT